MGMNQIKATTLDDFGHGSKKLGVASMSVYWNVGQIKFSKIFQQHASFRHFR